MFLEWCPAHRECSLAGFGALLSFPASPDSPLPLSCREYLTGFHKRKVERKKAAIEEMKQRLKQEQKKLREEVQMGRAGESLTLRGLAAFDGLNGGGLRG